MKKLIFIISLALSLLLLLLPMAAEVPTVKMESGMVVDDADILTDTEEAALREKLGAISESYKTDVVVYTTDDLGGQSAWRYAQEAFSRLGYGGDGQDGGIMLLVSMSSRDWATYTIGNGQYAFTDMGRYYIEERVIPMLSDGDYYGAFDKFASLADKFLAEAAEGTPYDDGHMPFTWPSLGATVIALVLALAVVLIIMSTHTSKLKSVRPQRAAASYVLPGSLKLRRSSDRFLYANTTRVMRQTSSSGGGGGARRSGGGGGHSGKF